MTDRSGPSEVRRARLVLFGWWVTWPLFHIGAWFLPPWFFEQVLVGLSVYAVVATKQDDYHTVQAKAAAKDGDGDDETRSGPAAGDGR